MAMGYQQQGMVEVVCGSMFSGKTEELMRRLKRAQYARQKIQVFKPVIDQRYSVEYVQSHEKVWLPQRIEIARHWHEHHKPEGGL